MVMKIVYDKFQLFMAMMLFMASNIFLVIMILTFVGLIPAYIPLVIPVVAYICCVVLMFVYATAAIEVKTDETI